MLTPSESPYLIIAKTALAQVLYHMAPEVVKMMRKNPGFTALELATTCAILPIGTAIPSAPAIAIFENGARIFIGIEGGALSMPAIATPDMDRYYGHQIF
jgi:hypothetical protein